MPSFQSSSIVGKRFHGILAAGQPRRVACTKHGPNQGNESGAQNPFRRNQNRKRGKESEKPCPDKVTESHACRNCPTSPASPRSPDTQSKATAAKRRRSQT